MKPTTILTSLALMLAIMTPRVTMAGGPPRRSPVGAILAGAAVAGAVAQHVVHGPPPSPPPGNYPMPPPPPEVMRPPMVAPPELMPPELMPPEFPSPELMPLVNTAVAISRMGEVIYSSRCYSSPIIVMLENGQRLYQPAVHGHPAYIQVWSSIHNDWISIKEHPSIW